MPFPRAAQLPLRRDHPCSTAFLDESGAISRDRIFAIGLIKTPEPARLLRAVQNVRDQRHWYEEIKFTRLRNQRTLDLYRHIVDRCDLGTLEFLCFVADRSKADPIERFVTAWDAYGKLAEQLLVAATRQTELVAVLADNYSTPRHVLFEETLRSAVNRRLHRLAVVSVVRLDSRSSDGLQVVDLLTSSIAFEFRVDCGLASRDSLKAKLAEHVRAALGAQSCTEGWRNQSHSVQIYRHGSWEPPITHG